MFKKSAGLIVGAALLASPVFALALSSDVQSQIDALLLQVKELQALIVKLQGGTASTSCVTLNNTLTLGSKDTSAGNDVTRLQNYLIAKGYLDAQYATGYYGFITAQAVGKMQIALGLLSSEGDPAYGFAGPKTRAAIACGTTIVPEPYANFSASPSTGTAPLYVTFKLSNFMDGTLQIDFGDGVIQNTDDSCLMGADCKEPYVRSHTYTSAGAYNVRLITDGTVVRTATITVTTSNYRSCTITASKMAVVPGEQFTLSWTATGIGDPVMYQQVKGGGYVSIGSSGTMSWTAEPNGGTSAYEDVFKIGSGGIGVGAMFAPVCSTSVWINPSSSSASATIDSASLYANTLTPTISGSAKSPLTNNLPQGAMV